MGSAALSEDVVRMLSREIVESRLRDWAREYGGGSVVKLGFQTGEHILARLIEFGGFLPGSSAPPGGAGTTAADDVERVVKRLAVGWPHHARVLRCDYFRPDMAMPARLELLRRMGTKLGRAGYYTKLESAKLYVAGAL